MTEPGIIVQARMTSSRFPCKQIHPINGVPLILHVLDKLKTVGFPIVVAIPDKSSNAGLAWILEENGCDVYKGEEEDVLMRFLKCARKWEFDPIIRVCGDSALIDRGEIIHTYDKYKMSGHNWLAIGLGVQIFSQKALEWADIHCCRIEERQHVWTPLEGSINYPEDIKIVEDYINGKRE